MTCKPGKSLVLADHLSRAYLNESKEDLIPDSELSVNYRVCATGRNCRQMRRKNVFGTKIYHLAKTSGEKTNLLKCGILISPILAILCHLIAS